MSEPATLGELLDLAETHLVAALHRTTLRHFVDTDAARDTIAARAAALSATADLARHLYGPERLAAHVDLAPQRLRPWSQPVKPDLRMRAVRDWIDALTNPAGVAPQDDRHPCPAADHYRAATTAIRAAADLVDTHRGTPYAARAADDGDLRAILDLTRHLVDDHHLLTRAREAGLPPAELGRVLPIAHTSTLRSAGDRLDEHLPPATAVRGLRAAGTVRTDTPAHAWDDRLRRVRLRLDHLAATGSIGASTMSRIADLGFMHAALTAAERQPWIAARDQWRAWATTIPADPDISTDHRHLRHLAQHAAQNPASTTSRGLYTAAHASTPTLEAIRATATRISPAVDRWIPAKPTPPLIHTLRAPPYLAWRPVDPPPLLPNVHPAPPAAAL